MGLFGISGKKNNPLTRLLVNPLTPMLTQLHIRNFALIDDMLLNFTGQLIVFTGETGAGKSILIDAIRYVLGEKLEQVRGLNSDAPTSVEAVFDLSPDFLRQYPTVATYLTEEENLLILRREQQQGRSRCLINQRLVNQSLLKELGSFLIDIHGQYDHQLLFEPSSQLELLDRYAKIGGLKEKYQVVYKEYAELMIERQNLEDLKQGREREIDLLKYQIDEIERAGLENRDEEALTHERMRLSHVERISEFSQKILQFLDGEETGASLLFQQSAREITQLSKFDPTLNETVSDFKEVHLKLEEVIRKIRNYQDELSFDPERFEEIDRQLDHLELLKKKYGRSLAEIQEFLKASKIKYEKLTDLELNEKSIDQSLKGLSQKLEQAATEISEKRKKSARLLKGLIESELHDLQLPNASFECQIESRDFCAEGKDKIEFLIRINAGQPLVPLRKIVSAGEVSRIMLALKKTLAKVDSVPTLIFDEIDSNIGGRLGTITGNKLKEIARERQVLLVTHLPQIASFADLHIRVSKTLKKGRTVTESKVIEGKERVGELSEMMSGKEGTEISKKHAEEMLERVGKSPRYTN